MIIYVSLTFVSQANAVTAFTTLGDDTANAVLTVTMAMLLSLSPVPSVNAIRAALTYVTISLAIAHVRLMSLAWIALLASQVWFVI